MDAKTIRESLTPGQIIQIYQSLGGTDYKIENSNNQILFRTICHSGDSLKLYYYIETKSFYCYTGCSESFDIFGLVEKVTNKTFSQSINHICNLLGIKNKSKHGFITKHLINDWEVINKYKKIEVVSVKKELEIFNKNILNFYSNLYHQSWLDNGISIETMNKYQIKFDVCRNKIIIPHFDTKGDLVGIRARNLNPEEVEAGKKYMPVYIQCNEYKHPLALNLYGLYQSKESIKRIRKVIIFEAEKSCLQCDTFYGENSFAVAVCGSNISSTQRDLILSLNPREVFIAFDKQYVDSESEEAYKYAEKITRMARKFTNYCQTYVLWDTTGLLNYKDSPSDHGKEVLEELMKNKYEINCLED